jgi:hypothetical protein
MRMSVTPANDLRGVEGTSQTLTLVERLTLLYTASVPFDGLLIGGSRSLPFILGTAYLTATILTRLTSQRHEGSSQTTLLCLSSRRGGVV